MIKYISRPENSYPVITFRHGPTNKCYVFLQLLISVKHLPRFQFNEIVYAFRLLFHLGHNIYMYISVNFM